MYTLSKVAKQNSNVPIYRLSGSSHANIVVNIRLVGFLQYSNLDALKIAQLLEAIPASHLHLLEEIVFVPKTTRWCAAFVVKKTGSPRSYVKKENYIIEVYKNSDLDTIRWALYHEIGHFVFYKHLQPKLRKEWVSDLYKREGSVSEYAKRNGQEDFAESYACYICEPARLGKYKGKYNYMSKLLRG